MTTVSPTQPVSTAVFLFGETQASVDALAHTLNQHGVLGVLDTALGQVSQAGREEAGSQVATVAHGLLDLDLGDLVVAGWRKHAALTTAAERTRATPGSSEVVELASHRVTSVYQPFVEVLINDARVATIRFELAIELLVKALVGTVRGGQLVSLRAGTCEVTGRLSAEGVSLVNRQGQFDLPLLIRLPLRLHPGGDALGDGTEPGPGASWSSRRRTLTTHRIGWRHRRRQTRQSPPAD
jgi:hypothetical protein